MKSPAPVSAFQIIMVNSMSDISEDDMFSYTNPLAEEVELDDTSPKGLHPNSTDFAHIMEEGKVKQGSFRRKRLSVASAESPNRLLENRVYDLSVNNLTYKVPYVNELHMVLCRCSW